MTPTWRHDRSSSTVRDGGSALSAGAAAVFGTTAAGGSGSDGPRRDRHAAGRVAGHAGTSSWARFVDRSRWPSIWARSSSWRTKQCCRLHALVAELVPGGISKEVVATQARSLLEGIHPAEAASVERHRQAVELVDEIDHLDGVLRDSRARITAAVAASETTVTEIFGVGPIVAAMLIGYSGDPTRFATATAPAAATTTASSPSDTPHARRSARSSGNSATSSGDTSSPTPAVPAPTDRRARAGH